MADADLTLLILRDLRERMSALSSLPEQVHSLQGQAHITDQRLDETNEQLRVIRAYSQQIQEQLVEEAGQRLLANRYLKNVTQRQNAIIHELVTRLDRLEGLVAQ